jgi:hypothetical protein
MWRTVSFLTSFRREFQSVVMVVHAGTATVRLRQSQRLSASAIDEQIDIWQPLRLSSACQWHYEPRGHLGGRWML